MWPASSRAGGWWPCRADDGRKLWAKDANYRHRPIIVDDRIIAEPWAFDLHTGEQQMRQHPLTGEQVPWSIIRPGHHCGMITGCENMLLFRSGFTGFYDLKADDGTQHIAGHRLGCWINAIPANGLVMIPEASAGCVCLFSIASTVVLEPREPRNPWTIYSSIGETTPVKHMALNLGAPGDRRDVRGKVWLAYPRPSTSKATGLDLSLKLQTKFAHRRRLRLPQHRPPAGDQHRVSLDLLLVRRAACRNARSRSWATTMPPATYSVKLLFRGDRRQREAWRAPLRRQAARPHGAGELRHPHRGRRRVKPSSARSTTSPSPTTLLLELVPRGENTPPTASPRSAASRFGRFSRSDWRHDCNAMS